MTFCFEDDAHLHRAVEKADLLIKVDSELRLGYCLITFGRPAVSIKNAHVITLDLQLL